MLAATEYAHDHGVTLVAAAGNGHTNYALPTRLDATSPDYPPGTEAERVVTANCLDLPSEAPDVISVSSVGPSGTKSDFSNYGLGSVEVSAPGGWFRDGVGTPTFSDAPRTRSSRRIRSPSRIEEELFDEATQQPTDETRWPTAACRRAPSTRTCRARRWPRRTRPASPR